MAIGAMKAVWDAGLRIPEDIAIVGAGNIIHGDMLRVPLTTVTWSRHEMGTRAAELLLQQLADPARPLARHRRTAPARARVVWRRTGVESRHSGTGL
jgi:DNA-binding LacI/PurR family transcriptional regulator